MEAPEHTFRSTDERQNGPEYLNEAIAPAFKVDSQRFWKTIYLIIGVLMVWIAVALASPYFYVTEILPNKGLLRDVQTSLDGSQVLVLSEQKTGATTFYFSTNTGQTWTYYDHFLAIAQLSIDWKTGNGIGTSKDFPSSSVYRTNDYGRSWESVELPATAQAPTPSFMYPKEHRLAMDWKTGTGFLLTATHVFKTNDGGQKWEILPTKAPLKTMHSICLDAKQSRGYLFDRNLYGSLYSHDLKEWQLVLPTYFLLHPHTLQTVELDQNGDLYALLRQKEGSTNKLYKFGSDYFGTNKRFTALPETIGLPDTGFSPSLLSNVIGGTYLIANESGDYYRISNQQLADGIKLNFDSSKIVKFWQWKHRLVIGGFQKGNSFQLAFSADLGGKWRSMPFLKKADCPLWLTRLNQGILSLLIISVGYLLYLLYLMSKTHQGRPRDISRIHSDSPTADDKLGFSVTTHSVVRLFKSARTKLPLTIALSGNWGKGKSSFMKQVRHELDKDDQFVTLWFNVWHYQTEEHMLSSFFTHIFESLGNKYSVRSIKQFRNWFLFKMSLGYVQFKCLSYWEKFRIYMGCFLITPLLIYLLALLTQPISGQSIFARMYDGMFYLGDYMLGNPTPQTETYLSKTNKFFDFFLSPSAELSFPIAIQLVLWAVGFFLLKKGELPKGLNTLTQIIPFEKFRLETNKSELTLRDTFKKELNYLLEVANIRKKKLVVFLDDFDRISGDKVREMLETINFVTDTASQSKGGRASPEIVFMVAMSLDETLQQLGKVLNLSDDKMANKKKAALYIEKLVDLVVPIPSYDEKDIQEYVDSLLQEG